MPTNAERAQTLIHALPYIQKYAGKIVVIKYGGNAMIDEGSRAPSCAMWCCCRWWA